MASVMVMEFSFTPMVQNTKDFGIKIINMDLGYLLFMMDLNTLAVFNMIK